MREKFVNLRARISSLPRELCERLTRYASWFVGGLFYATSLTETSEFVYVRHFFINFNFEKTIVIFPQLSQHELPKYK